MEALAHGPLASHNDWGGPARGPGQGGPRAQPRGPKAPTLLSAGQRTVLPAQCAHWCPVRMSADNKGKGAQREKLTKPAGVLCGMGRG